MSVLLQYTIQDPQDLLDDFGAGAVIRIERSSDYDSTTGTGSWTERTTKAVVAGTTSYEYRDTTATEGTDWFRWRASTSSPSVSTDYSGYLGYWRSGLSSGPLALETIKTTTGNNDTVDDGWAALYVNAINAAICRDLGVDFSPSPDTTRTYDACEVTNDGRRLWVPGGIRSFTAVQTGDGTTWTTVTSYVRVGPLAHSRPIGTPGSFIEVIPGQTTRLDDSYFVKITGTAFFAFGWDAWPADIVQVGTTAYDRARAERAMGGAEFPTSSTVSRFIKWDRDLLRHYRETYGQVRF